MFLCKFFFFVLCTTVTLISGNPVGEDGPSVVRIVAPAINATEATSNAEQLQKMHIQLDISRRGLRIGTLRGGDLYHEIYRALEKACPEKKGSCNNENTVTINTEMVQNGKKSMHQVSAHANANWGGKKYKRGKQMRRNLIGMIAGAVERSIWDANCFRNEFGGTECVIPHWVTVQVDNRRFHMEMFFSGIDRAFKCEPILELALSYIVSLSIEVAGNAFPDHKGAEIFNAADCFGPA